MSGVRRSRWSAVGAALAVVLGAGGLTIASASSVPSSSFVSVTPVQVLDTRTGVRDGGFTVFWLGDATGINDIVTVSLSWAYTAP